MANAVLIIGETGSGKSTSLRTLDPKTTFIINVSGKPLPFRGWKLLYKPFKSKTKEGNYISVSEASSILQLLDFIDKELPEVKTIVVEDFNYVSGFELMSRVRETGYEKFNIIARNIFDLIVKYKSLRDDLVLFYTNHPEISQNIDGEERIKAKTAGKMVDQQIVVEGLFTTVLFARARRVGKENKYLFETQTDGKTPSKSPMGMFESFEIPNDLQMVRDAILSYNE